MFDKIQIDKSKRFLLDEVWDLKLVSKFAEKKKLLKKRTPGTTDFIKIIWSEIHLCTCARALCQSQANAASSNSIKIWNILPTRWTETKSFEPSVEKAETHSGGKTCSSNLNEPQRFEHEESNNLQRCVSVCVGVCGGRQVGEREVGVLLWRITKTAQLHNITIKDQIL